MPGGKPGQTLPTSAQPYRLNVCTVSNPSDDDTGLPLATIFPSSVTTEQRNQLDSISQSSARKNQVDPSLSSLVPASTQSERLNNLLVHASFAHAPVTSGFPDCGRQVYTSSLHNQQLPPSSLTQVAPQSVSVEYRVPIECTHVARGHSNAVLDVDLMADLMLSGSKVKD
ncbi:unnamed protein product [Protopolystoma xenopodis]|uniref:Uncharacterized protein n=1 Tax=Protopolystoma xenopodis TaxID=117903 RepID=A0A3S5A3K0_9PLAT|nr:unnamed protein product [Protopolystoma xenopodis]